MVAIHDHDINDDVNMAQSGAHLVGEILPRSGGRTGSPSIVSWKATIYKKKTQKYQIHTIKYQMNKQNFVSCKATNHRRRRLFQVITVKKGI